ncbi:alpha/beta-hydrolase [Ceratobasidium sp. AG-I]|nr:alpha/beta-hydrolase [Ceratobasidium sp. AG-I]
MSPNFPPDTTLVVPSTKGKRGIRINVYKPPYMAELEAEKASEKQGKEERYPVHINLHGSGFVINIMGSDGEFCRTVSNHTGAIVLDCDYAKAPEHPFPAAYEDVCDVVAHVLANENGRYDTSRLTIGGFSAGGVLSLVVSATMPQGTFKAVTAFYPQTNLNLTTRPSPKPPGKAQTLPPFLIDFFHSAYIPHNISRSDPRLSPHNNAPSAFPKKVFLVCCEFDPLRDEILDFAKKLKDGGADVEVMDIPGVLHGWDKDAKDGTEDGEKRAKAYDREIEVLRIAYQY